MDAAGRCPAACTRVTSQEWQGGNSTKPPRQINSAKHHSEHPPGMAAGHAVPEPFSDVERTHGLRDKCCDVRRWRLSLGVWNAESVAKRGTSVALRSRPDPCKNCVSNAGGCSRSGSECC